MTPSAYFCPCSDRQPETRMSGQLCEQAMNSRGGSMPADELAPTPFDIDEVLWRSSVSDAPATESPRFIKEQRNPEQTRANLARWLSERVCARVEITELETPSGAGVSNETFLFRARWHRNGD